MVAGSVGDTALPCTSVAGAGSAICSHACAVSGRGARPLTVVAGESCDMDDVEAVPQAVPTSTSTRSTTLHKTRRRNQRDADDGGQKEPLAKSVRMEYPILPENDRRTL